MTEEIFNKAFCLKQEIWSLQEYQRKLRALRKKTPAIFDGIGSLDCRNGMEYDAEVFVTAACKTHLDALDKDIQSKIDEHQAEFEAI